MKVLLIGGGGREHALAWKLSQSARLQHLYAAPGNPGIARHATCVAIDTADHAAVIAFCKAKAIDLVVVGPEAPLVAGLVDDLERAGVMAFGPSKAAARLEGSKGFTKDLCREFAIPTAAYARFSSPEPALAYVSSHALPLVVKADGLAAGKGVVIAETALAAEQAVRACFEGAFGAAGAEVVIEEFLTGEEASFFVLVDGANVIPLATAQDHKRAFDGDTGPNTGGMGAYSPAPVMTDDLTRRVLDEIIAPTVTGMAARGTPFKGVLYAGLMVSADGPKLIEYNVRFGDPECQALMVRLQSDLLEAMVATCEGRLGSVRLAWCSDAALTVVVAAEGYPGTPATGSVIRALDTVEAAGAVVFHAGTAARGSDLVASGGRVLGVTALGATVAEASHRAYAALSHLDWPGGFYRRDIGWRALSRSPAD
ncbi:MAG: phosphoribosylamine--glycine ligase [Hyphomicrobiaceae bacterium]